MARILLVARHGETDWNVANRWQGQSDVPLNERGRAQARALAARLRGWVLGGVVSSDLSRARETAEILASALGLAFDHVDVGLRERSFGCFEGLTRDECIAYYPNEWLAWQRDHVMPVGGESADALLARATAAFERAARGVARDDAPGLVVTHGGVIRAMVAAATGERPPPIQNAELWRMEFDERNVMAHVVHEGDRGPNFGGGRT
ncbi:MAG: histidine phosphatase family protein [Polyangiaceae bacterium]|jgi:probable phosphoglycerate mutase